MPDDLLISPYRMDRGSLVNALENETRLVPKPVAAVNSITIRKLIELHGAGLPHAVRRPVLSAPVVELSANPLPVPPPDNDAGDPVMPNFPSPTSRPAPPPPPAPSPGAPRPDPAIVTWGLYALQTYRQDWKPTGYGPGDLSYTTSLLPGEEITLEVKTSETSVAQQDREDTTEERNLSDIKSTDAASNEISKQAERKSHEEMSAGASYGGFGFSAEVKGGWSNDARAANATTSKRARERCEQAASERRSTQKTRVTLSRTMASESKTTRRIRNINQAHTLHVNFFDLLQEYRVSMTLAETTLVLLGAEFSPSEVVYDGWSLGRLVQASQAETGIKRFLDYYGQTPYRLLREHWTRPLYDAAFVELDWAGDSDARVPPEARADFVSSMLRWVRPVPGWFVADEMGVFRWAYEVVPGAEEAVLRYLYTFVPYSAQQFVARAKVDRHAPEAIELVSALFVRATGHLATDTAMMTPILARTLAERDMAIAPADRILAEGPFKGALLRAQPPSSANASSPTVDGVASDLVESLLRGLAEVRKDVNVEIDAWTVTTPTHSQYVDLSLGAVSGAEDYFELQRQFDLELKRNEIAKLRAETRRLDAETDLLESGRPRSSVVIENPAGNTALNVSLDLASSPAKVAVARTP
jgi:hypothetical protein